MGLLRRRVGYLLKYTSLSDLNHAHSVGLGPSVSGCRRSDGLAAGGLQDFLVLRPRQMICDEGSRVGLDDARRGAQPDGLRHQTVGRRQREDVKSGEESILQSQTPRLI